MIRAKQYNRDIYVLLVFVYHHFCQEYNIKAIIYPAYGTNHRLRGRSKNETHVTRYLDELSLRVCVRAGVCAWVCVRKCVQGCVCGVCVRVVGERQTPQKCFI